MGRLKTIEQIMEEGVQVEVLVDGEWKSHKVWGVDEDQAEMDELKRQYDEAFRKLSEAEEGEVIVEEVLPGTEEWEESERLLELQRLAGY